MKKILLTSAGFENPNIEKLFLRLLEKPAKEAKALFIPTAAIDDDARSVLPKCWNDLVGAGIPEQNIVTYNLDRRMEQQELAQFDTVYFCGGSPQYLLERVHAVTFEEPLGRFIEQGGVYVGVSAGSWIAARNLPGNLGYANCILTVHDTVGMPAGLVDLSECPPIVLTNRQALLLSNRTEIVE